MQRKALAPIPVPNKHDISCRIIGDPTPRDAPGAHAGYVFGIGLGRTGTHSLNSAFNILGYHSCHLPTLPTLPNLLIPSKSLKQAFLHYDGGTDSSVALHFRELHDQWPNSKFVLTVRDKTSWLRSCKKHFQRQSQKNKQQQELRLRLYGAICFDPLKWEQAAIMHMRQVLRFFSGKNMRSKLLILDIAGATDGWLDLCAFLNIPLARLGGRNLPILFPKIHTENQYLRSCEFACKKMQIGLLYLCKSHDSHSKQDKAVWIRRRCLLLKRGVLFVYRRPDTPLCSWEDKYNVKFAQMLPLEVSKCMHTSYQPQIILTLRNVHRLMENKKARSVLILGLDSSSMMENWCTAFQRCTRM
jgi:hypothetical protein